jgi:serine/threonine protein kinase
MVEAVAPVPRFPQLAKYEILEEIGHGGMASVYRARDKRLGREVAVKIIHPHLRTSSEVAARFRAEARAVAKLRHPNIVEVYDVSDADEAEQYLVVELVRGTTLRQLKLRHDKMPPEIAAVIALEVLDALACAHESGVVHRDVKPENVLVALPRSDLAAQGPSGEMSSPLVKLADFGIAKLLDAPGMTSTGQVMGSPAHMAPEQIEAGEADARSDLFAVGVVLYECMTGHPPFEGNNPAQVLKRVLDGRYAPAGAERPAIGSRWSAIIDRALKHRKEDRFATASSMRAAIALELERLDSGSPDSNLRQWLVDPADYVARTEATLAERLRLRGDEGRQRGDAIGAAWDYNRALAYAPDDGRLLRVIASIQKAERRSRAVRRAAMPVLAIVGLMVAVLWSGPFRSHSDPEHAVSGPPPAGTHTPSVDPGTFSSIEFGSSAAPSGLPGPGSRVGRVVPALAAQKSREPTAAKPVQRSVTLDLKPPMGISVSVDGQPDRFVTTGDSLVLDSDPHVLVFNCKWCTAISLPLAAGEKNETLDVAVPIRPATLVIKGKDEGHYQLVGRPELKVSAGTNTIPLKSAYDQGVVQEIDTGATVHVKLEAGQVASVSFE